VISLALVVPTKGRPANAARLIEAVNQTTSGYFEELVLAVDHDDPMLPVYRHTVPPETSNETWDWVKVAEVSVTPQRMGPVLNHVAADLAREHTHIAFMGDDHLPVTHGWDAELVDALGGKPGVAYGNDLVQGEKLPTAVVISSDIIRSLGYFCPPGQMHLYLDDFWKMLGQSVGNLAYRDDVVIEHLHPTAGKAPWDDGYASANSADQYNADHTAYTRFVMSRWPADLAKLKEDLGL
jgi:hypothetical protein